MKNNRRRTCPNCKSKNVAKILWGEPVSSETLKKKLEEGKVYIGGCCVPIPTPKFHCNDCGYEWAKKANNIIYDFPQ